MGKINIKEINRLFQEFQTIGKIYKEKIGEGLTNLDSSKTNILTKSIPDLLVDIFPKETYKIKGSIGQGRITKCPWIAIMNKNVTTSTQEGVYLVFLLSSDLQRIYFQLGQGVTKSSEDDIFSMRETIRHTLGLENQFLRHFNEQSIDDERYKRCAIYAIEWDTNDPIYCEQILTEYKTAYDKYVNTFVNKKIDSSNAVHKTKTFPVVSFSVNSLINNIQNTGLIYSETIIKRLAYSLMAKPFVILSGLAGSGKTQLALAFAKCLSENIEEQVCTVSIGADWTNREPLLGYPNALKNDEYVLPESGVLQLLMRANEDQSKPYFLILDEMNLSVVERYFADFLSAMESGEPIKL
jgi:5-methylcytosine-specific restriction protein B